MNPYPGDNSVLILDNCRIHKTNTLLQIIADHGKASVISFDAHPKFSLLVGSLLMFLPAYSPNLNPIEHSFSASMFFPCYLSLVWLHASQILALPLLEGYARTSRSQGCPSWGLWDSYCGEGKRLVCQLWLCSCMINYVPSLYQ